ncbi:MAG: hypothetical protein CMJ40_04380 [Phycisphaerae bacterium]|nr:hypothetical protein [Phycisphaerae bacterium]
MKGPCGHSLLVTGDDRSGGWATGTVQLAEVSMRLHGPEVPISTIRASEESIIEIFFSGESEGAIPWGSDGWEFLRKRVGDVGGGMLLRPHHRHVLADAPACRHWLCSSEPELPPCGLALSPTSILVPSMVAAYADHMERLFEFIGQSCGAVILEDFRLADSGQIQCVSMGSGLLDGGLVGGLINMHVPSEVPIIIHARSVEKANSWLWPGSSH